VSWCGLEVELASPKAVAAGAAELAQREPPPLVVAALNLKTVLQVKARAARAARARPRRRQRRAGCHRLSRLCRGVERICEEPCMHSITWKSRVGRCG
jgi:hypothetical protein